MKSLIATALLVTSMSTFALDLTLSPIYTAVDLVRTAVASVVVPTAATTGASVVSTEASRQQLAAVRADAVDFLAGSEASESLKASIAEVKTKSAELNEMSDSQIAGLIVTALE